MDIMIHAVELEEAVKEYNEGGGLQISADDFSEYSTAAEAVRELEGLEMEEEAALEHLLDSTMIMVFIGSIIVKRTY